MGRKAKRLRLMKKLATKGATQNPSLKLENSVAIEELKNKTEILPEPVVEEKVEPVVEEKAEPVVEEKAEPKKTTTRRRRSPRKSTKSSK